MAFPVVGTLIDNVISQKAPSPAVYVSMMLTEHEAQKKPGVALFLGIRHTATLFSVYSVVLPDLYNADGNWRREPLSSLAIRTFITSSRVGSLYFALLAGQLSTVLSRGGDLFKVKGVCSDGLALNSKVDFGFTP